MFTSASALVTMVVLLAGPFAAFTPPYEEVRFHTPGLSPVVLVPLPLAGAAAIVSAFVARRPPNRRHPGLLFTAFALHLLTLVAIIGAAVVFLVAFAGFNFDGAWLHWGFYVSTLSAGVALAGVSRALPPGSHGTCT